MSTASPSRRLAMGLLFVGPNVLGFLAFTLIPMLFSIAMAFTNWNLQLHNPYKREAIRFVGVENFVRLFSQPEFLRFLGNTLFFMMSIPLAIALSLLAAVALSQDLSGGGSRRNWAILLGGAGLITGCIMLTLAGAGASAMSLLVGGLVCLMLIGGVVGGRVVYRTLFYLPSFTSGVAVFILWKQMYNSQTGPINAALRPLLDRLAVAVGNTSPGIFALLMWISLGLMLLIVLFGWIRLRQLWRDGEIGGVTFIVSVLLGLIPIVAAGQWSFTRAQGLPVLVIVAGLFLWQGALALRHGREFPSPALSGMGSALMLSLGLTALAMVFLGLAPVLGNLPAMADDGLQPPSWLNDYHWAKPALMIMGLWGAIGSQNMLLYIAALSNVPPELYEAADIDGATRLQRFWHVTWPQLAPTTFFIVVMSVIGGLQSGFETARTMTNGGPAGATTTLSYFIFIEGFETQRLGYSSAVAWTLFAMVLVVTIFNLRVGSRYVNE